MKSLLLIAMLIVGLNCWPVDKDIDNNIDNEDIWDKFSEVSSFSEESSKESSEESSDNSSEKSSENSIKKSGEESSEIIKVPNYGPRAFAKPKEIGDSTVNPRELGKFDRPVDKDINNYIDKEDIRDKFRISAKVSSFSEESTEISSKESSEESSDNSTEESSENPIEKLSEIIKVPNYGPRAFAEPKEIGDSSANPGELGEFAEGDIRMPSDVGARSGLKDTVFRSYRWQRGPSGYVEVPVNIEADFSKRDYANFVRAYKSINDHTCVRFIQYTDQRDYVVVTNNQMGCFSYVGRIGGKQQLNLQSGGCLNSMGTPAHELMHALGIIHEHSRPDRDNYVTIQEDNIAPGERHNFNKYSDNEVDNFGLQYGYDSVMHYTKTAFSANGYNTIEPKRRFNGELGQREGPTKTDYAKINIMYGCD